MKFRLFIILYICLLKFSIGQNKDQEFKVIGYYVPTVAPESLPMGLLTHVNFSFAIPSKAGDTLLPLSNPNSLINLVKHVHEAKKSVFISIGGWGIGDGGGDDTRFHKMAETEKGRNTFVKSTMRFVRKYNLDGVDLDWEYPDENSISADHYLALVNELGDSLHREKKLLTAAVISYGSKSYGIKKEVFEKMDWLNIMAYDDDYGPNYVVAHSPYSLAKKSLEFWIQERGLHSSKAILGLPFYSKKGMGNYGPSYKDLLKDGASPFDDYWKGAFYNGTLTTESKTKLAKEMGCGGVMIWEIALDSNDENSLLKVINKVKNSH
jgi:GH18 family chitinase